MSARNRQRRQANREAARAQRVVQLGEGLDQTSEDCDQLNQADSRNPSWGRRAHDLRSRRQVLDDYVCAGRIATVSAGVSTRDLVAWLQNEKDPEKVNRIVPQI